MSHLNDNVSERLDVELMLPGDRYQVSVGPDLRRTGWRGGIWVKYIPSTSTIQLFEVEASDGVHGVGFLLFASGDHVPYGRQVQSYNWTSRNPRNEASVASGTNVMTMVNGGSRIFFKVFETVSLTGAGSRTGPAAVYTLGDKLKISENGWLCNDPDANLLAATGGAETLTVGFCASAPDAVNGDRLCLDMKF